MDPSREGGAQSADSAAAALAADTGSVIAFLTQVLGSSEGLKPEEQANLQRFWHALQVKLNGPAAAASPSQQSLREQDLTALLQKLMSQQEAQRNQTISNISNNRSSSRNHSALDPAQKLRGAHSGNDSNSHYPANATTGPAGMPILNTAHPIQRTSTSGNPSNSSGLSTSHISSSPMQRQPLGHLQGSGGLPFMMMDFEEEQEDDDPDFDPYLVDPDFEFDASLGINLPGAAIGGATADDMGMGAAINWMVNTECMAGFSSASTPAQTNFGPATGTMANAHLTEGDYRYARRTRTNSSPRKGRKRALDVPQALLPDGNFYGLESSSIYNESPQKRHAAQLQHIHTAIPTNTVSRCPPSQVYPSPAAEAQQERDADDEEDEVEEEDEEDEEDEVEEEDEEDEEDVEDETGEGKGETLDVGPQRRKGAPGRPRKYANDEERKEAKRLQAQSYRVLQRHNQEQTAKYLKDHRKVEAKCEKLTAENAMLREELERLREENAKLRANKLTRELSRVTRSAKQRPQQQQQQRGGRESSILSIASRGSSESAMSTPREDKEEETAEESDSGSSSSSSFISESDSVADDDDLGADASSIGALAERHIGPAKPLLPTQKRRKIAKGSA